MERAPYEYPDPCLALVPSRPQAGATTSPDSNLHQTGGSQGRAVAYGGEWTRGVLLWSGDDHAASHWRTSSGSDLLPWRPDDGAAQRLVLILLDWVESLRAKLLARIVDR